MAHFEVSGIDALSDDLAALAALPESVLDDILNAEADVIEAEQRKTAREMGIYDTGITAGSIKKGKSKKSADGKSITVMPTGTNKRGDRNAEVAFFNEYGKKGQPARPFIRTANERAGDRAVEAGEKVYHAYLDSKNL
ncbi:MAG: hypothetical protein J1E06_05765 [Acutalibacter sp.]|nr:hypothetical protein [Acutalibacter sp.]